MTGSRGRQDFALTLPEKRWFINTSDKRDALTGLSTVYSSKFSSPCRLLMPESKVPSGSGTGRPLATVECRLNRPQNRRRRDTP